MRPTNAKSMAWYEMEWKMIFPYSTLAIFFHSILKTYHFIFHSMLKFSSIFHSALPYYEELVVQNLRREPHSSVTVRRFRKLKGCCHVIAIPSGWHSCPNLTVMQSFEVKKVSFVHLLPSFWKLYHTCTTHLRIEPGCGGLRAEYHNHYTTQLAAIQ